MRDASTCVNAPTVRPVPVAANQAKKTPALQGDASQERRPPPHREAGHVVPAPRLTDAGGTRDAPPRTARQTAPDQVGLRAQEAPPLSRGPAHDRARGLLWHHTTAPKCDRR